jgi:hypothetical protein
MFKGISQQFNSYFYNNLITNKLGIYYEHEYQHVREL